MKNEKILRAIGEIDDDLIKGAVNDINAQDGRIKKYGHTLRWAAAAACLCLISAAALAGLHRQSVQPAPTPGGLLTTDSSEPSSELHTADNTEASVPDRSPVSYSSLKFSGIKTDTELDFPSASASMDIKAFDESCLSQDKCCMILEGTITRLYTKHYTYDIYSDKFEENGVLHSFADTVVYELAVDKTWYGDDISGQTILVEDTSYCTTPILAVKEGGRYVLPLYEYGDSVWTLGHEYAGGDITRDSRYSTIYPYHPQIAVTDDGSYFLSKDWTTLTVNARDVIMENPSDEFQDKMCLVDADTFTRQMAILTAEITGQ